MCLARIAGVWQLVRNQRTGPYLACLLVGEIVAGRGRYTSLHHAGDMDLDPETGEYRFSATVPGVEINALRETLGVRPLPFPLSGAIRGTLHCTGPLEEPAFSGAPLPPKRRVQHTLGGWTGSRAGRKCTPYLAL